MSSCPDCIFEIHQLWQSGFSRVYSNCCCSCSFEPETIKIGQSSHRMYSNNILNFQESTPILNSCTKKSGNLLNLLYIYIYIVWYEPPHLAKQKQDNQLEHTYSSYVRIRDVALKICQRRWIIGRSGERGSGISVLAARHDDDDDDDDIYK